ncbi:unnamed protein product [Mytilus coruscus]|uniref:Uncharacterized protein n=1 Tax=Mytilus coruscus TaxID=42192 RepID=A0A6J8EML0_MYTCO|nr:unnamed protein product [Mytilus coruscus]
MTKGSKKFPTKQGASLTLSRWLMLKSKKDEIDLKFKNGLDGKLEEEDLIHLGGGVYITINPEFPTVDIRHFWRPQDAPKAVATKRGVALNKFKWERLCYVMDLMIDFVPELNSGVICEFTHDNEMGILACKECNPFPETDEDHPVPEAENDTLPLPPLLDNQEGNPEIAN